MILEALFVEIVIERGQERLQLLDDLGRLLVASLGQRVEVLASAVLVTLIVLSILVEAIDVRLLMG